jgi:hypothetical protein
VSPVGSFRRVASDRCVGYCSIAVCVHGRKDCNSGGSTGAAGLGQHFLQHQVGLLGLAFGEMVSDPALCVNEAQGRPVVVVERLPEGVVANGDAVADHLWP